MRKVFSVFRSDWRRLTASVVTVVVIIGLCLVPCLYAWFNIFSNWDPYGTSATSNIHIAVASEDEGRDILGVKLNIGDMVIDALHSNDQMGWQFLDTREEALAGVESGEYYAALIMPTDLTSDFVSILEGDLRHPQIQYYENEKKNAIAPKITNKAKTAVQEEINSTVIETVANAVTTANSVFNALGLDAQDVAQRLTVHLEDASASMAQLSATLQSLQSLSDQAGNLIGCAGIVIDDVGNVLQSGQSTIGSASQLLPENAELTEVIDALDRVDQQLDRVQQSIDKALSDAAKWHEFLTGGLDQVDKQLAAQQGMYASFMPKPVAGQPGSAMFLYQSLFSHEGENLFWAPKDYHVAHLSDLAQHYVAGILKYAPEFTLVTNPTVNSYKRFISTGEVPNYATWGRKNRSALVRIPAHKPGKHVSTRIELRSPDPTANPYLALAATIAAGLKGIEEELPLPEESTRDTFLLSQKELEARGIKRLPRTLGEAIQNFEESELLREVLGDHIFEYLVQEKKHEWNDYCTAVTDWEREHYYGGY